MINKNALVILLITLLSIALIWVLFFWSPPPSSTDKKTEKPVTLREKPTGGDFTVKTKKGDLSLNELRGKVVLLYFGYTQCPDICPTSLSLITSALTKMDEKELENVVGLFISVDPNRDTTDQLAEYTHYFHSNIIGATTVKTEIDKITRMYGAAYRIVESDSAMGYTVDHSSYTYMIDKKGKLRDSLKHGSSPEEIVSATRKLLAE